MNNRRSLALSVVLLLLLHLFYIIVVIYIHINYCSLLLQLMEPLGKKSRLFLLFLFCCVLHFKLLRQLLMHLSFLRDLYLGLGTLLCNLSVQECRDVVNMAGACANHDVACRSTQRMLMLDPRKTTLQTKLM